MIYLRDVSKQSGSGGENKWGRRFLRMAQPIISADDVSVDECH